MTLQQGILVTERADYLQLAQWLRSQAKPIRIQTLFTGFGEPDLELLETAEVTRSVGKRAGRRVVPAREHGRQNDYGSRVRPRCGGPQCGFPSNLIS